VTRTLLLLVLHLGSSAHVSLPPPKENESLLFPRLPRPQRAANSQPSSSETLPSQPSFLRNSVATSTTAPLSSGYRNQKISIHHLHHGGHDNVILSTFAPCNQKAKRKAFKTKLKTDVPTIALLHKKYTRYITTNQRKSTHTENHCHSQTPPPKNRTKKIQKEKEKNHR